MRGACWLGRWCTRPTAPSMLVGGGGVGGACWLGRWCQTDSAQHPARWASRAGWATLLGCPGWVRWGHKQHHANFLKIANSSKKSVQNPMEQKRTGEVGPASHSLPHRTTPWFPSFGKRTSKKTQSGSSLANLLLCQVVRQKHTKLRERSRKLSLQLCKLLLTK